MLIGIIKLMKISRPNELSNKLREISDYESYE